MNTIPSGNKWESRTSALALATPSIFGHATLAKEEQSHETINHLCFHLSCLGFGYTQSLRTRRSSSSPRQNEFGGNRSVPIARDGVAIAVGEAHRTVWRGVNQSSHRPQHRHLVHLVAIVRAQRKVILMGLQILHQRARRSVQLLHLPTGMSHHTQ